MQQKVLKSKIWVDRPVIVHLRNTLVTLQQFILQLALFAKCGNVSELWHSGSMNITWNTTFKSDKNSFIPPEILFLWKYQHYKQVHQRHFHYELCIQKLCNK